MSASDVHCPTCGEPWHVAEPCAECEPLDWPVDVCPWCLGTGTVAGGMARTGRCPACPRPRVLDAHRRPA